MTPEMWQRLKPLFDDAMEKPPEERDRFVDKVCGDDPELRGALHELVRANGESTSPADIPLVDLHDFLSDAQPAFAEGELVLGRFRIIRKIGGGGMGEVYEAMDLEMGRIALKTIRPEIAANPEMLARFKKEVQLALKISGPHVCRIYAFYALPPTHEGTKRAFLTMEFLEGITLADRIRESGPLSWREAKANALEICAGLRTIHEAGIVHRDLKNRNIMLASRNGSACAVLMDFGLAREFSRPTSETATNLDSSSPGKIEGTLNYMAPEQFEGKEASPATDIYALGVVLYEMVTQQQPFAAYTPVEAAIQRGKHPCLASSLQRGLPGHCDEVIGRCLEFDPKLRYQSAEEVAEDLRSRWSSPARLRARAAKVPRSVAVAAAIFVCLTLAATVSYLIYRSRLYQPPSAEAERWYEKGLAALREGTYLQAINALKMAIDHDKRFLLAHARLAEAWAELDFTSPAQTEMLTASVPEQERNLPELDRQYIGAIRATLTQDFSGAEQDYGQILHALPDDQKAYGYLDLARAYEKAGDISNAVKNYEIAAKIDPEDPAPFEHLGILKCRRQDKDGGEAAFKVAESLYEGESNMEGRAEVAYQRGYAANVRADSIQARSYLETSLQIARQIPNPQLEVRTLAQISGVEDADGRDDKAIEYAKQEIQLAQENGIEYWGTDGLNRLGTAYFGKEDFPDAERSHQEARHLAEQNHHPRLEANAQLGLASIRDQQGKWDESIPLAQEALQYYKSFAYMSLAALSTELIIRGEEGKGDTMQALQSANELLQLARKWNDPASIETAEASVGNILLDLERFPDALAHFEEALKAGRSTNLNVAYQEVHCADALWRLGRYSEAEEMLGSIPEPAAKRTDIAWWIELTRAQMRQSEQRFGEALSISRHAEIRFTGLAADKFADFEKVQTLAEADLGQTKPAQKDAQQLLALAHQQSDEELIAEANMTLAIVDLQAHRPDQALPLAEAANRYFFSKGEKESEWLSLYYLAKACKASGDIASSSADAKKALDILGEFEHTWSPSTYQQYTARPDHQIILRELVKLRAT